MLQPRRRLRLDPKPLDEVRGRPRSGRQQLDSDFALKALLPGAVDHAHAACAKQFEQLVVAEVALLGVVEIEFESCGRQPGQWTTVVRIHAMRARPAEDRKSTRLNSSH